MLENVYELVPLFPVPRRIGLTPLMQFINSSVGRCLEKQELEVFREL